jgi:SAM-dependent methyltransferase
MTDAPHDELPSVFEDGDLYDLILGEIPYGLDFYLNLARSSPGPVLDVACGTGRILIPALEAGIDIEGVDLFEPMLERLRHKAAARGLSPTLHQADMSRFALARRFDLIMIPFNAVIHNMTQEAQLACFEGCRQHLLPGGRLVFDTFFPSLEIVGAAENTRVLELEFPHPETGLPVRLYDTRTFDRVAQTQHSINEIELLAADGSVDRVIRSQVSSRYMYKHELELLLRVAGFSRWEIFGSFEGEPLEKENQGMIVVTYK